MKKHVLIVDDDEYWRRKAVESARSLGWTSEEAGGFHEACHLLEEHQYDLVISDNSMEMRNSGIELLYWMRRKSLKNEDTPFVLCTSDASCSVRTRVEKYDGMCVSKQDDLVSFLKEQFQ